MMLRSMPYRLPTSKRLWNEQRHPWITSSWRSMRSGLKPSARRVFDDKYLMTYNRLIIISDLFEIITVFLEESSWAPASWCNFWRNDVRIYSYCWRNPVNWSICLSPFCRSYWSVSCLDCTRLPFHHVYTKLCKMVYGKPGLLHERPWSINEYCCQSIWRSWHSPPLVGHR